ncbi:PilW family protein [Methylophilus sp. OH31]|uniref:PilW family protein n=1 Tax=Methylophilus sp. OH31 TaxID=1387312 RepID=UPI0004639952|nr:PilW family protein [Methylophilus sp. OH31]
MSAFAIIRKTRRKHAQSGMSLVELLVGILIGLVATLAISNLFSGFEARKRTIAGGADAQSSGVLAMYYIQRDAQNAGYGLPLYNSSDPSPLLCPINTSINQAGVVINLSPVVIVDGGAGNDIVRIRYGNPASGGASMRATGNMNAPSLDGRLIGCQENDVVLFHQTPANPTCSMARLKKLNADRTINTLSELNTVPTANPVTDLNGADWVRFSCIGVWNQYEFAVSDAHELTRTGGTPGSNAFPDSTAVAVAGEIVSLQAQYGVADTIDPTATTATAAAYINRVDRWVDATGQFGTAMVLIDRNRIRSMRVAVVARDGNLQKATVSQPCNGNAVGVSKVCIWQADANPVNVDLSAIPNWQRYRYRTYEATIPLRNVIWNRDAL